MTTSATRSQFEVFKFYLALYGFHKKGGSEKFFLKGAATLKRYVDFRNGIIKDILTPLSEGGLFCIQYVPSKLSRALKGTATSPDQILALGSIFYDVCLFYKSRSNLLEKFQTRRVETSSKPVCMPVMTTKYR